LRCADAGAPKSTRRALRPSSNEYLDYARCFAKGNPKLRFSDRLPNESSVYGINLHYIRIKRNHLEIWTSGELRLHIGSIQSHYCIHLDGAGFQEYRVTRLFQPDCFPVDAAQNCTGAKDKGD
jgi:hypothetical protein